MGGGDLNLKKSWHPSTMKNMERVWKAEQQKDQERKRIAELKKEIEMEKDREDITKYAMEQGVIEKKDEKKLDWMYKGPHQMVNREEYLLGRPIDKSFEQMAPGTKDSDLIQPPKNHVEYECIPPSLRFFSGNEQVDLARKMQEDPLYAIKKKEMETRSQLLKNPVKLKQLRQLLEQQSKKDKSERKRRKKKLKHKRDANDSNNESDLDMLLATKYKQLKGKITEKELLKSMKRIKHKRKKKLKKQSFSSDDSSDSSSEESSSDESSDEKQKKKRRSTSGENMLKDRKDNKKKHSEKRSEKERVKKNKTHNRERSLSKERHNKSNHGKGDRKHKREREERSRSPLHRDNDSYKNRETAHSMKISSRDKYSKDLAHKRVKDDKKDEHKWNSRKSNLTEEEKERRRQEMIANATWRDKERERNVKQYREEEKKELNSSKTYNQDFITKQLAVAAEVGTVASRIKSNINNIQRSGRAMDTNFAKR